MTSSEVVLLGVWYEGVHQMLKTNRLTLYQWNVNINTDNDNDYVFGLAQQENLLLACIKWLLTNSNDS